MFDTNILNNACSNIKVNITHHGMFGGVAEAHYDNVAEAICFVSYVTVGDAFVIMSCGRSPSVTEKEAQTAGDFVDAALEQEAAKLGIKQLLIVYPDTDTAEVVRTYTPQPFTMGVTHKPVTTHYLN